MSSLEMLGQMIKELEATSSTSSKQEILAKYPELKDFLYYCYNPFYQYGITSANVKKKFGNVTEATSNHDLKPLLDALRKRELTGHDALMAFRSFQINNHHTADLANKILDKDLKCRVNISLINKVFPNLIPDFSVALGSDITKLPKSAEPNFDKETWFVSRKLDGCRCICIKNGSDVNFYSRSGKEFLTLDKIKQEILKLNGNFVLDGEISLKTDDGSDDFQGIMKEIRKKNHTIKNPFYHAFDLLSIEDFERKDSQLRLGKRFVYLNKLLKSVNLFHIDGCQQIKVESGVQLDEMMEQANNEGWEGLIVRKNDTYKGKRSNDILKVKKFFDEEYEIKGINTSEMNIIGVDGHERMVKTMKSAIIHHKGHIVFVGSGWSVEERIKYFKNPALLTGQIITVRYFEETTDKDGNISLRFPTKKCLHGKKREV